MKRYRTVLGFLVITMSALLLGQVPPSCTSATINVYDANGQYLGILIGHDETYALLFMPSLGRSTWISKDDGTIFKLLDDIDFESDDCTGQAYVGHLMMLDLIAWSRGIDRYFVVHRPIVTTTPRSAGREQGCVPVSPGAVEAYLATEISVTDIPFTLPAAVPFNYVYE